MKKISKLEPLEEQFHKNLDENKQLKHRNDTVKREMEEATDKLKDYEDRNFEASAAIKKLQHQIKNLETENKKIKAYRDKVKEELKLSKSESRVVIADLGQKIKDLENDIKALVEKNVEENSCQTDAHPDIPYKITVPLPPIFSSQLCHKSRPIHLSDSLPSLDSICWSKPDGNFLDEAEEALNEQYDKEIREFYLDERDRVRAARNDSKS